MDKIENLCMQICREFPNNKRSDILDGKINYLLWKLQNEIDSGVVYNNLQILRTPEHDNVHENVVYWLKLRLTNKQFDRVLKQILPPGPVYPRDELPPPGVYDYIINTYLPKYNYKHCYICLIPGDNSFYRCDICEKLFCHKHIHEIRFYKNFNNLICPGCIDWHKFVNRVTLTQTTSGYVQYLLAKPGLLISDNIKN